MHYSVTQANQALRFQALAGNLPMSQYPADLFYADTSDSIPVIPAAPRVPAGHRAPGIVRRAARVAVALGRLVIARRPRWAVKALAVAVIIPGFVDELLILPAIVVYVVIRHRAEFAATARNTWKAGQAA